VTELTHRIFWPDFHVRFQRHHRRARPCWMFSSTVTVSVRISPTLKSAACDPFCLAARYVSGYPSRNPPPGEKRLIGRDASHAWLGVFFPASDGIGLDPTNGVIPSVEHITLAWARELRRCKPRPKGSWWAATATGWMCPLMRAEFMSRLSRHVNSRQRLATAAAPSGEAGYEF